MSRVHPIAVDDGGDLWRGAHNNRNILHIQAKCAKRLVARPAFDIAVEGNLSALPDDGAGDGDLSAIFGQAGAFNIEYLLFFAHLEGHRTVGDTDNARVLRAQKLQAAAHGGKYLTGSGIEIDIALFIIRQGFPETAAARFRQIKGEPLHLKLRHAQFSR